MRARRILFSAGFGAFAFGCVGQPNDTQEIVDNLVRAGFPADDIMVVSDDVYVGRDAKVSLAASREMLQTSGPSKEQYRTTNLIKPSISKICIDGSTFTGVFSTALDLAIQNYDEQLLSFAVARMPSTDCGAVITGVIVPNVLGGSSGFPSGGLPFSTINIGSLLSGSNVDTIEHVITHEIGHTIGFRHSDYFNRAISCGGSAVNEGPADVGAILIPGTPSTATVGGSFMNSCFRDNAETGEFTATDLTALKTLYGTFPATSPAIAVGSTGPVVALHGANTDLLWTVTPDGAGHQTSLVLAPGTNPAIAIGTSGTVMALHGANTDFLWTVSPDGGPHQTAFVMAPGTSPAIAIGASGPVVAIHGANTDLLWTIGPDGVGHPTAFVMAPGTSPAIAIGPSGPVVAIHGANTDFLWTVTADGVGHPTAFVMAAGTSPAIASDTTGPVVAIHGANTDLLWTVTPDGVGHQSNFVLALSTSPAIASDTTGPVVAIHGANTDLLWTVTPDGVGHPTSFVLAPGTSPAIALGSTGPVIALHGANTDLLWTVTPDGVGHQSNFVLAPAINP